MKIDYMIVPIQTKKSGTWISLLKDKVQALVFSTSAHKLV